MFKPFLLNEDYSVDLKGNVLFRGSSLPWDNGSLVTVSIGGDRYQFDRLWLGLITHYEVNLPLVDLMKIRFVECTSRVIGLKCSKLMTFTNQISLDSDFFIIPGFTNFAITRKGEVKSVRYGRVLKPSIGPYGYPYVNVYDPDKERWRSVSLHILLARTFIHNSDPTSKFFVNHKDGIKTNFELKNLEWVTGEENQRHAIESGLRRDNKPCTVFDRQTGAKSTYVSISLALASIGYTKKHTNLTVNKNGTVENRLFFDRYEIIPLDERVCVTKGGFSPPRKIQIACQETGKIMNFPSIRSACAYLGVDKRTLKHRLRTGKLFESWIVKEMETTN